MELGIFAKSHFLLLDFLILCLCFYKTRKTFNISAKMSLINDTHTFRIVKYEKNTFRFQALFCISSYLYSFTCDFCFFRHIIFKKSKSALSDCCLLRFCTVCDISYADKKSRNAPIQSAIAPHKIPYPFASI